MSKKKKNKIFNIVMIAAIVIVIIAGLMATGTLKGWFGEKETVKVVAEDGSEKEISILAENKIGSVNIERSGIAYSLENGNSLRSGDMIETLNGSSIDLVFGKSVISLDENCLLVLNVSEDGKICFDLNNGGIFMNAAEEVQLDLMDRKAMAKDCVFSASAHYGSANVYVYENSIAADEKTLSAGEGITLLAGGSESAQLSVSMLNTFELQKITEFSGAQKLCFTAEDVEKLNAERDAAKQEAMQAQMLEEEAAEAIEEQRKEKEQKLTYTENKKNQNTAEEEDDAEELTCTITIRCDTILDNMGKLTEGKNKYVPANGCILATSRLTFEEGETAFDILQRACKLAGIQLEYSWTPLYNSHYIEGINHLYEFDCGEQSGWMYKVNGWYPNYGCSAYTVKDGDAFVWAYTCDRNDSVGGNMR